MVLVRVLLRSRNGVFQHRRVNKENLGRYIKLPKQKKYRQRSLAELGRLSIRRRIDLGIRPLVPRKRKKKILITKPVVTQKLKDFWVSGRYSRKDKRVVAIKIRAYSPQEVKALRDMIGEAGGPTVSLDISTSRPTAEAFYSWKEGQSEVQRIRG